MTQTLTAPCLSTDFLSQYINKQPKWGFNGLGYIVYLRTYARTHPDGTLERWDETVQRVTEGNFKIEMEHLQRLGRWDAARALALQLEMERFYHLTFNLVLTPPGRGLWMSGTPYAERVGDAENNCWFVSLRPQPYHSGGEPAVGFAAAFTFDQAMKGGGVGVNVQRHNVAQVPRVTNALHLTLTCDTQHADYTRELAALGVISNEEVDPDTQVVPDSREGWAQALAQVVDAHYNGTTRLTLDLSRIRPRHAPIKGFGGVASGPTPLVDMLQKVNRIINKRAGDYVTPTEWGDVIQNIGCCVVAGNVRRTALILIGDQDDQEFVESKNYGLAQNLEGSQWRWASNNSVDISADTDLTTFQALARNIYFNGEPGYVNVALSRDYGRIIDGYQPGVDAEVEGFNPCGEITLPNGSPCNLFEVNLPRIHELVEAGVEGPNLYQEAMELAARYAYRITFRNYEWDVTRDVVHRHRRLGVGITGITDWILLRFGTRGVQKDAEGRYVFNPQVASCLDELYGYVRQANVQQAQELGASPSIKVTTVKPSGTVSILMGVSPGQHFHWAPYMFRRVRMAANAPLVDVLRRCGYELEYAIRGQDAMGETQYDHNTVVATFPIKAPTAEHPDFQSAGDVALGEQAALQALLATHWSDNAVSATLSFHKAKPLPVYFEDGSLLLDKFGQPELRVNPQQEQRVINEIADLLYHYRGTIKSTSLLPYATDTFPQMPYEEISRETYEKAMAKLVAKPWELLGGVVQAETEGTLDTSTECVGGACPLR